MVKLLDVISFCLFALAAYIAYTTNSPYELTHYFLAILGLTLLTLTSLIKDNYVDLAHIVVCALIWYMGGLLWASGYLLLVTILRRRMKLQLLVASSYCINLVFY